MNEEELIKKRIKMSKWQIIFDIILILFFAGLLLYCYLNVEQIKVMISPCEICMQKTNMTCFSQIVPEQ